MLSYEKNSYFNNRVGIKKTQLLQDADFQCQQSLIWLMSSISFSVSFFEWAADTGEYFSLAFHF